MSEAVVISDAFVEEVRAQLGKEVVRLTIESGLDSVGEPSLWAWVVLRGSTSDPSWDWDNRQRIRLKVPEVLRSVGLTDWVYVRFDTADEDLAEAG